MANWAMIWPVGPEDADFLGVPAADLPAERGPARSRGCGPLGVLDEGGRGPLVVRPDTSYDEFCRAFDYEGDEAADSAWVSAG